MSSTGKFNWRDVWPLMRTNPGRFVLRRTLDVKLWPLVYPLASSYRRLIIPKTRIIAVTGSNGKSSTVNAITNLLQDCEPAIQTNHYCFLARSMVKIKPGQTNAAFEVGATRAKGSMKQQVTMLKPDVVVITSIGSEHASTYENPEGIRREKALFIEGMNPHGIVAFNGDEPHVRWMVKKVTRKTVSFGFDAANDLRAQELEIDWPRGMKFQLKV